VSATAVVRGDTLPIRGLIVGNAEMRDGQPASISGPHPVAGSSFGDG